MSKIDFTDLIYDFETGFFYRAKNPTKKIGCVAKTGYIVFSHQKKIKYAHRVAWAMFYGEEPKKHIDHINRIKTDNRIANLRLADDQINNRNRGSANHNNMSCGFLGVTKPKHTKKWSAAITVDYKRIHIGYYDTPEEAHKAYIEAKKHYHPTSPHLVAHA